MGRLKLLLYFVFLFSSNVFAARGFDNNLFSLLPGAGYAPGFDVANDVYRSRKTRKIIFALESADWEKTKSGSVALSESLSQISGVEGLRNKAELSEHIGFWNFYYPYHRLLLSDSNIKDIKQQKTTLWVNTAITEAFSPVGMAGGAFVTTDPLGLLRQFFVNLKGSIKIRANDGFLSANGEKGPVALIYASLAPSVDDINNQETLIARVENTVNKLPSLIGIKVLQAGALFYLHEGTKQAKFEISVISFGSFFGIILFFLFLFRSIWVLFMGVGIVALGMAVATGTCLLIFEKVHIFTLVMGSSLVGITIDYVIHFYCQRFNPEFKSGEDIKRHLLRPLTFSFLTTIAGFLALVFLPFPVLKQISVFFISGLTFVYGFIVLVLPKLPHQTMRTPNLNFSALPRFWLQLTARQTKSIFASLILLVAVSFFISHYDDDIRRLQLASKELKQSEAQLKTILGVDGLDTHYVVGGVSPDQVLEREESLIAELKQHGVDKIRAISQWIPSLAKQEQSLKNYDSLKETYEIYFSKLGVSKGQITAKVNNLFSGQSTLEFQSWLDKFSTHPISDLWIGKIGDSFYSALDINGLTESQILTLPRPANTQLVNFAVDLSSVIKRLRVGVGFAAALGIFFAFMLITYVSGFWRGLKIITPPIIASFLALGVPGLFVPLNIFNLLAAILVFGMGIDYAIFYAEQEGPIQAPVQIAVFGSFVTTFLSFGLLMLSQTPALASFGSSLSLGMFVSYLLAPSAMKGVKS